MTGPTVTIGHSDARLSTAPWARELLTEELARQGFRLVEPEVQADVRLLVCPPGDGRVRDLVDRWRRRHDSDLATTPESFAMASVPADSTVLITAADDRGLGYALLELYDIAQNSADALAEYHGLREYLERPRNVARGITRIFTTAATDRAWFHDQAFWQDYLTHLACQRFNRFSLGLGAMNDYLIDRRVTDNYLCFPYPFLTEVDGYDVRAEGVSDAERERNLESLRFIAREATRRGLDFGLGLWNHAYRYDPDADTERWPIRGLGPDNHAEYSRDGLTTLLQACPEIGRLTFRVHFEGGVPEPTHEFWRVVLSGLLQVGRLVELDFHAKGVSAEMIAIATDLGVPLTLSTKHWGEHQGLPYQQAAIREKERTGRRKAGEKAEPAGVWAPGTGHPDAKATGTQTTSRRSFTRYGYGDYAHTNRPYRLLHRVWPGTQRVLLWGDPVLAAGYGRHADFADALGMEWFEPMSFLGKKDSAALGSPDGPRTSRRLYQDDDLHAAADDWQKYRHTYRLLGRTAYEPETPVAELTRELRTTFGGAADATGRALGAASRVLPLVTVLHAPSTACNVYWPEMPTPVSLLPRTERMESPYRAQGWPANSDFDMTPPYSFGNVSPLDPELIYGVDEFAADVLAGQWRGKHTPVELADRLEQLAEEALTALAEAEQADGADGGGGGGNEPLFRVVAIDVRIQAQLARYFASALRAAVAYGLRSLGRPMLARAVDHQRSAIAAWDAIVEAAKPYVSDLPFGQTDFSRGTWADRRPALLADLAALGATLQDTETADTDADPVALEEQLTTPPAPIGEHTPAEYFEPGKAIKISWRTEDERVTGVRVRWRPVNQALAYSSLDLEQRDGAFVGEIPTDTAGSLYSVQYFFEVTAGYAAWPYPGLAPDLANQPYYVVHTDPKTRWGRTAS
ncbi:hypothetical protein ABN034_05870 [Actinopolymorpha sp. B11F2]|uniref:hypothetical protein n=1 Tax=Actinopolymorpha sp. B11F2 TaxID=3160862 RepID=UPI0032E3FD7E